MQTFIDDPSGLIPFDFATPDYQVIGFKLIRFKMYVMVKSTDSGEQGQYPYVGVFTDCFRAGRLKKPIR